MKKITELTPEQEAQISVFRDKWEKIGLSTDPFDPEKIKGIVRRLYEKSKLEPPKDFYFVSSPKALKAETTNQFEIRKPGEGSVSEFMNYVFFGSFEASWLSFTDYIINNFDFDIENQEVIEELIALAKEACWCLFFDELCIISDRPEIISMDENDDLHSLEGSALKYRDGYAKYVVHGVEVPDWIIEEKHLITAEKVDAEQNAEVRRVMIDIMGQEAYLTTGNAVEIHRDDFGTLYSKEVPDDETIVMVKVVNSSPEPDGSIKDYFLRVPPTMKTAHDAVAWTFGKTADTYKPVQQT